MASVSYSNFLPDVLIYVPGCSKVHAINAIRNAAIEFCSDTHYWQELQDAEDLVGTDFPFTMLAPSGASVSMILDCIVNGRSIKQLRMDYMDANVANWRAQSSNEVQGFYQESPETMSLYPALDDTTTANMQLRVAYAPTRTSTTIDSAVYNDKAEAIAAGALKRLLSMVGQPFANPQLAMYYEGVFNREKGNARVEAEKSFGRASMRVQPRRFG